VPVKAAYLLAAGGGAVILYAGFKGKKWTSALRDITTGKNPGTDTTAYPISTAQAAYSVTAGGSSVAASPALTQTGEAISSDAMQYEGAGYTWGGVPGATGRTWDCSSFCNAVIGRDLHLAIPLYAAGTYHGQSHGPTTLVWLVWTGAFNINRSDVAPGDLIVWQSHMGIAVSNDEYISAYDTQKGTTVMPIKGGGPFGEVAVPRRLKAVTVRG
jgi:cell wall-associated NlpC family hydrolase